MPESLAQIELLMAAEPRDSGHRNLKAVVLSKIGDYGQALDIYADILAKHPRQAMIWMSYAHALASAGRIKDSIAAYRRCLKLDPNNGEAIGAWPTSRPFASPSPKWRSCAGYWRRPIPPTTAGRICTSPSARRWKTRPTMRIPSCTTRWATHCAWPRWGYNANNITVLTKRSKALFTAAIPGGAQGLRQRRAGSHIHRRPAARRLDLDRADPGQPLFGGRHHGIAEYHRHRSSAGGATRPGPRNPSIPMY